MDKEVSALADYDYGAGPALYAGGLFSGANDSGDSFLAKWGCLDTTAPVLDCPSSITVLGGTRQDWSGLTAPPDIRTLAVAGV